MKKFIGIIPIPMSGLMLGLASAGNLAPSYGDIFKIIFGSISFIILVLLAIKIIYDTETVAKDMKNPAISGIASTFPMGMVVLSAYLRPIMPLMAYVIWIAGILTQCILMIYYTKEFIISFNIKKIFPSCFVVYVGIAAGSLVAPVFNASSAGKVLFWFGFVSYIILLPIITYRVVAVKAIPEPLLPTVTIFAAPASLCLAGYLSSFQEKNIVFVWVLVSLSLIMFLAILFYMPKMLKLKFYPSYSAFTFPLVISAVAMKNTYGFFTKMHMGIPMFKYLVHFEEIFAVIFVIYVLARYMNFIFSYYINVKP